MEKPETEQTEVKRNWWQFNKAFTDKQKAYAPDELWAKSIEYFEWCDSNPWHKNDFIRSGDNAGKLVHLETARPYTITGLCLHLEISDDTFQNYSHKDGYEAYFGICKRIRQIIYTQKFEGAAVGAFNANIIARDLGLVDKKEQTQRKVKVTMKLDGHVNESE